LIPKKSDGKEKMAKVYYLVASELEAIENEESQV